MCVFTGPLSLKEGGTADRPWASSPSQSAHSPATWSCSGAVVPSPSFADSTYLYLPPAVRATLLLFDLNNDNLCLENDMTYW